MRCRPYLESSWLVDLFTPENGMIGAITTASRRQGQGGAKRSKPQYFQQHQLRLKMKHDLARLSEYEQQKLQGFLRGHSLYAALYMNELLLRLLPRHDPHPRLYMAYHKALGQLIEDTDFEPLLRRFEHILLRELGAGITWDVEARTRAPIEPEGHYYFSANEGFISAATQPSPTAQSVAMVGAHIIAVGTQNYQEPRIRRVAKLIMRAALAPLLGERPLNSRVLFSGRSYTQDEIRT